MKPRVPLLNPSFKYRCSASTDVAKTWREHRKRMEAEKAEREKVVTEMKIYGTGRK